MKIATMMMMTTIKWWEECELLLYLYIVRKWNERRGCWVFENKIKKFPFLINTTKGFHPQLFFLFFLVLLFQPYYCSVAYACRCRYSVENCILLDGNLIKKENPDIFITIETIKPKIFPRININSQIIISNYTPSNIKYCNCNI